MRVFALPYRIHFDDTMAYGSHHYLTNFKFQCAARERLYFSEDPDGTRPWQADRADLLLLTVEGYSRNMAPVQLADDVIVFMTLGELSRSSVLCFFRTVRSDGEPVACGYQRIVTASASNGSLIPLPTSIVRFQGRIDEITPDAELIAALHRGAGPTKRHFPEELRTLARRLSAEHDLTRTPQFIELATTPVALPAPKVTAPVVSSAAPARVAAPLSARADAPMRDAVAERGNVVLLFPGQGSFDVSALRGLFLGFPMVRDAFLAADVAARAHFNTPFLPLVATPDDDKRAALLAACPDLDQLGIYLTNVLTAELLCREGLSPAALVGHSFGELAAFTVAGAMSIAEGTHAVCARVKALRLAAPGKMLAVSESKERVRAAIAASGLSELEVAVVNHSQQTVVSGPEADLTRLADDLAGERISATLLKGRYPFHSRRLAACVGEFAVALRGVGGLLPRIPVFSPIGLRWHRGAEDLSRVLPMHFVEALDFEGALAALYEDGYRSFVECGAGTTLEKLVQRNLGRHSDVRTAACILRGEPLPQAKARVLETLAGWGVIAAPVAAEAPVAPRETARKVLPPERASAALLGADRVGESMPVPTAPIALVGTGSVLPGAAGEEQFWRALREGTSGIVDFAALDAGLRHDFMLDAGGPDKTYSLLGGYVADLGPFSTRTAYDENALQALSKPERMLACALAELKAQTKPIDGARTLCLLGATADGSIERDEEVFLRSVADVLRDIERDPSRREAAQHTLSEMFRRGPAPRLDQHAALADVVRRHFGASIRTILIDAACASSLYAVGVAMSLLELGVYDAVIAGGVYEPGPANACLFSQFKGLSATGTRPFDARADGVVFGEGAAVALLKRLPDAQRDKDRIRAVIRAVGVSSDGRSPSVNVPRAQGQSLAMRRAYTRSGVDPASIQFVEAHATATRVGDATEFQGLLDVFGNRDPNLAKIRLESCKNQIGHTGWVAGVASMIKVMRCFEERTYPAQHGYAEPSPKLALEGSPFVIPQHAEPWPENVAGAPRRAAVDGFGFGGTNAHVVMEEFRPRDWEGARFARPVSQRVAVVGLGALYPDKAGMPTETAPQQVHSFDVSRLPLPKKMVVLPDVRESMDATQLAALLACDRALLGLPLDQLRDDIGVVIGLAGKTALSVAAGERIFLDRLMRLGRAAAVDEPLIASVVEKLKTRTRASGPYTLPGAMPNVTAGRVANLLDVHGPNFVLDTGASSLADSLKIGPQLLAAGCKVVLVGGLNAFSGPLAERLSGSGKRPIGEGALVLALALEPTVKELNLPVLAWLDTEEDRSVPSVEVGRAALDLRGAEGAIELQSAILQASRGATTLRWPETQRLLRVVPPREAHHSLPSVPPPPQPGTGFVTGTPILIASPVCTPRARAGSDVWSLTNKRTLAIISESADALGGLPASFVTVSARDTGVTAHAVVDTSTEVALADGLKELTEPELLLFIVRGDAQSAEQLLTRGYDAFRKPVSLLFGAFKRFYAAIEAGRVGVAVLVLGAAGPDRKLRPESALFSGFAKAQVREMPNAHIRIVLSDCARLNDALPQLEAELAEPGRSGRPEEVCYFDGERHVVTLSEVASESPHAEAVLDPHAVVLATGGARGITAVLVEALLERTGCTVYLVGRSDPAQAAPHVLAMTDAEFSAYEKTYYAEQSKRRPQPKMADLKRAYEGLRSVREVAGTLRALARCRGNVVYRCADVQNSAQLGAVVEEIRAQHGRLDLVVHGAGVQVSKRLPAKSLDTFAWIVDTKLTGLSALHNAIARIMPAARPHMHLMTSAFSYIGNDGQPDYGAANETMNRLAGYLDGPTQRFSALAWLGWDGIGMTAGSEFAALGERRGLRGVRADEGQEIFLRVLSSPTPAVNITIAQGEIAYFGVDLQYAATPVRKVAETFPVRLSLTAQPYLARHLVRGRPVVPGTMQLELVARAARKLYPRLFVTGFDHVEFTRFIGLAEGLDADLRVTLEERARSHSGCTLRAEVRGAFKHASGKVLDADVLHAHMEVRLDSTFESYSAATVTRETGKLIADPYACGAAVDHQGPFAHLADVALGNRTKNAIFRSARAALLAPAQERWELPMLLLDACLTLGMILQQSDGSYPVCAAHGVERIRFGRVLSDALLPQLGPVVLYGTVPEPQARDLHSLFVQARGSADAVLVDVRGLRGSPMGEAPRDAVDRASLSGHVHSAE